MSRVAALVFLLAFPAPGQAMRLDQAPVVAQAAGESEEADGAVEQVPLTARDVESFIDSLPAMRSLGKRLEREVGPPEVSDLGDIADVFTGYLANGRARAEIESTLRRHGFESFNRWARVTRSIIVAYASLGAEAQPGETDQSFEKSVEEIRKDPSFSPEQKEEMIAELNSQLGAIEALQPLPGNVEAVRPYELRLRGVLEQE